jgi:hypothetical protein
LGNAKKVFYFNRLLDGFFPEIMKEEEDKRLVDATGQPVGNGSDADSHPQPELGVRAYIDAEVAKLGKNIRDEQGWRWKVLSAGVAVLTGVFGLSLFQIWREVPRQVEKRLIEPKLEASIDSVITRKASGYVDSKIKPLGSSGSNR